MGVNEIVLQVFRTLELPNVLNKEINIVEQFGFIQWVLRTSRDMHDAVAVAQIVQNMRDMFILGSCKNVDPHTTPSQFTRQISDVHVHATGVLSAECRKWTGMVGKHRDAHRLIILQRQSLAKPLSALV